MEYGSIAGTLSSGSAGRARLVLVCEDVKVIE